jgi:hypothetical protein
MIQQHTPTPWSLFGNGHCIKGSHETGEAGIAMCSMAKRTPEENAINAAFIVKAVNHHEALVEALKGLHDSVEGSTNAPRIDDALRYARSVLSRIQTAEALGVVGTEKQRIERGV